MADQDVLINEVKEKIENFIEKRNWIEDHNPKNLSMSIAIEAAELMEIFQWISIEEGWKIKETKEFEYLKEEIADVLIYTFSLCNQLNIDISKSIYDKMGKNETRFPVDKFK